MKRIARIFEYVTICDSDNRGIASVKDEQRTRQTNLNPGMAHLSAEVPTCWRSSKRKAAYEITIQTVA